MLPHLCARPLIICFCSKTLQTTEAFFLSGFGWGLTKKIENYGLAKFKANLQRVCAEPSEFTLSPV